MRRFLSFDPLQVPVVAVDDHLPAVDAEQLQAPALRERFTDPERWRRFKPEIPAEPRFSDRPFAAASVLIPLVQRQELHVLLTRRTDHLHDHAGQISFPGGRQDAQDVDPIATALRETHEEVGIEDSYIDVIGTLPVYTTGTGFHVTPVVALLQADFSLQLDSFEVAEVFEVPLAFFMNPAHHRHHQVEVDGQRRTWLSMPYEVQGKNYFTWGATAGMLRNLYRFLSA